MQVLITGKLDDVRVSANSCRAYQKAAHTNMLNFVAGGFQAMAHGHGAWLWPIAMTYGYGLGLWPIVRSQCSSHSAIGA